MFDADADLTSPEFAAHHPTTNIIDINVTRPPTIEGVVDAIQGVDADVDPPSDSIIEGVVQHVDAGDNPPSPAVIEGVDGEVHHHVHDDDPRVIEGVDGDSQGIFVNNDPRVAIEPIEGQPFHEVVDDTVDVDDSDAVDSISIDGNESDGSAVQRIIAHVQSRKKGRTAKHKTRSGRTSKPPK